MIYALLIIIILLQAYQIFQNLKIKKTMSQLDDAITALQNEVTAEEAVEQSAITLINGIASQIAAAVAAATAAGATPAQLAEITALQASITTSSQALAAAVSANTPAAS